MTSTGPKPSPFAWIKLINSLNAELNPICQLLALLAHHILHFSGIRVKLFLSECCRCRKACFWISNMPFNVTITTNCVGAVWREPGGRAPLLGDPEGYLEKALKTGISFHRGSIWGTWRRARVPGILRAGWRGSGDGASLSQEAVWRGPQGGLLYWGTWKMGSLRDIQNAL